MLVKIKFLAITFKLQALSVHWKGNQASQDEITWKFETL